jgi:glycosyltransferase involved in cell wall biosynthesis
VGKTIYILAPYPKGEAPSQRFRFEQYIDQLESEGYQVKMFPFLDQKTWKLLYSKGKTLQKAFGILKSFLRRWGLLFRLKKADFVFVHREVAHIGPPLFEWLMAKVLRINYTYDFDDATWLPNYSETNAKFNRLKAYWKVKYCIKWAHQVTAGNEYLAEYAKKFNPNVQVIPTTIDLENHHTEKTDQSRTPLVIGWTGSHTTMRYLDFIVPILEQLENKFDFEFHVISNESPKYKLKSLKFVKWNKSSEIKDLARLHIGIMPLEEDIWSKGKCGFKALQYMALEIPTVASPVGVNSTIINHEENGFLCSTPDEWEKVLTQLLESQSMRQRKGGEGFKTIKKRFSVQANWPKYLGVFEY